MKFFDSKEEVLDIELTQYGRHLLSKGSFKPVYYAFFDENILYDANYGGISETKNEARSRIQNDTPTLKTQATFVGREEFLFDDLENDLVTNDPQRINVDSYESLNVLTNPLGTSTLDSTKTPAFIIQFLEGEVTGLENNFSGNPSTAGAKVKSNSQQLLKIPQIQTDIEFKITVYEAETQNAGFVLDPSLAPNYVYDDGLSVAVGPEQLLMQIEEKNVPFEYDNFDIEVYEITDEIGPLGEQVLKKLSFVKPIEMVSNNLLLDQEEAEYRSGRSFGQAVALDPSYVEYYFNINVDTEIDQNTICRSIQNLKSKNIIIDTDIRCPDLTNPIRSNIYFSDAEDDKCIDN